MHTTSLRRILSDRYQSNTEYLSPSRSRECFVQSASNTDTAPGFKTFPDRRGSNQSEDHSKVPVDQNEDPVAMTGGAGEFRRAGTRMQSTSWAGCDMPRPLHITKRSGMGRGNRIARNPRGCSPESDLSDATTDSPTELPGGNRPLTIPKRRGDRGGWVAHRPVGRTRGRNGTAGRADGWNPPSVDSCLGCSLADVEQLRRHPTLLLLLTLVDPHHA